MFPSDHFEVILAKALKQRYVSWRVWTTVHITLKLCEILTAWSRVNGPDSSCIHHTVCLFICQNFFCFVLVSVLKETYNLVLVREHHWNLVAMSLFSDAEQSNSPCKQDLDVQWAEFEVSEMHFIGSLTNSAVWCFLSCCFFFLHLWQVSSIQKSAYHILKALLTKNTSFLK